MVEEGIQKTSLNIRESLWADLGVRAAQLRIKRGEALEAAIRSYLGQEVEETKIRSKDLRDAHALLDTLYENLDHDNYAVYWSIIKKLLATVKEDFGSKNP